MSEFHFEDPDLKNSTLEKGFPSCAIEKDNFIDSQGKLIRTENKEFFSSRSSKNNGHIVLQLQSPCLLLKVPSNGQKNVGMHCTLNSACKLYSPNRTQNSYLVSFHLQRRNHLVGFKRQNNI